MLNQPVQSESSLSSRRNFASLAIKNASTEDRSAHTSEGTYSDVVSHNLILHSTEMKLRIVYARLINRDYYMANFGLRADMGVSG